MLRSRLPQIIRDLDNEAAPLEHSLATRIAQGASSRAPRRTGALADSYRVESHEGGAAVMAAWYWHFVEFGTSHSGPHPHLVPAVEEVRSGDISAEAKRLLGDI